MKLIRNPIDGLIRQTLGKFTWVIFCQFQPSDREPDKFSFNAQLTPAILALTGIGLKIQRVDTVVENSDLMGGNGAALQIALHRRRANHRG